MKRSVVFSATLVLLNLGGCMLADKQIGDDDSADESGDGDGDGDMTGDGDGDGEPSGICESAPFYEDPDCDGFGLACDNANDNFNPDQRDQDSDGFGDVVDVCPLIATDANTADSDKDGIGNSCDRCRLQPEQYFDKSQVPDPRMWVRNVPVNTDFDQDGVGDACDNCVVVANCQAYGPDDPAPHGADAFDGNTENCQIDADADMIGDACIDPETELPINGPLATGPVGFGPTDDFDQDGLANLEDGCPRLPLAEDERIECTSDADCGPTSRCATTQVNAGKRFCNHGDVDGDFVGDICDTCVFSANPMQVTDIGMQIDDEDGDFVGVTCETNSACNDRKDEAPIGFYDVSVGGLCCVTTYPGDDVLHDPDGAPVRLECSAADWENGICQRVPDSVAARPGVVQLPPGCEAALADAGVTEATALTLEDVGGDPIAYWEHACRMPQSDQDFDGVGDACDLCLHAFDPYNEPYIDEDNKLWDNIGAKCAGAYSPKDVPGAMCPL